MKIKPGSCGKPQPGRICNIVNHKGKPLPQGEIGILAVKQTDPGLFKEYWDKADKTKESFKNGWFLTGDVLFQDEDGYYWFSGRDDDLIMAAAPYKYPQEIEFVEELPKTQSDKIKRKELRELEKERKGV